MRGFKNFKGSDAGCPSIHFLFYGTGLISNLTLSILSFGNSKIQIMQNTKYKKKDVMSQTSVNS